MTQESLDGYSSEAESAPPQEIAPHPSPYRGCTAAAFADINQALATRSLRTSVYQSPLGSHSPGYLARPAPQPSSRSSDAPEPFPRAARMTYISSAPPYSHLEARPKNPGRTKSLPVRLLGLAHHDENDGAPRKNRTVLKCWTARRSQPTSGQPAGLEEKDRSGSHKEGRAVGRGNVQGSVEGKEHAGPVQDRKTRKRRAGTCIIM